jgi:hypothetical protein
MSRRHATETTDTIEPNGDDLTAVMMVPAPKLPSVATTTRRIIATLDRIPTEAERQRIVGALASLYLPGFAVQRDA